MTADKLQEWVCASCKTQYSDPIDKIPGNKTCVDCAATNKVVSMKKITSTGVKPAETLKEILARDYISKMNNAEQMEYLKLLGFTITDIEQALQPINLNEVK